MSKDKLEIVRGCYEAFNRGDLPAALEDFHPEVVWHTYLVPGPGGGTYRGLDGVHELWADVLSIFEDFRNDPEEFIETGEHELVVFVVFRGRGRESGVEVEAKLAHVISFRAGMVVSVRSFEDREEALRTARGSAPASSK